MMGLVSLIILIIASLTGSKFDFSAVLAPFLVLFWIGASPKCGYDKK